MNGRPWDSTAACFMRRHAGTRSAAEIATMTGHSEETVRRHIRDAGLKPYHPARRVMSRRDQLLASAAGLDAPEPDHR